MDDSLFLRGTVEALDRLAIAGEPSEGPAARHLLRVLVDECLEAGLRHDDPNVRIVAIGVFAASVGGEDAGVRDRLMVRLRPLLGDDSASLYAYGGLQCEEEDAPVTVSHEAAGALVGLTERSPGAAPTGRMSVGCSWHRATRSMAVEHRSGRASSTKGDPMTDPAKLCETVRAVAIRAHRLVRRATSMHPDREEIEQLLEDIDRLGRMISDFGLHQTQLAAWVRNLRREVESRAVAVAP
jgi:hypothetical protein